MNANAIKRFLMALDVEERSIVMERDYVNSPCPMAAYMHAGGIDTRPSFGIRIEDEGRSSYYCFGCTPEARLLERLLHNIWVMSGRYPFEAARIFVQEENHGSDAVKRDGVKVDVWETVEHAIPEPLPYSVVNLFPPLQGASGYEPRRCLFYLEHDRHIAPWAAKMTGVRYDPTGHALVFPMTDLRGHIFLLRARSRKEKSIWTISPRLVGLPEELAFPKLRHVGVWFGMNLINWREPVMLVEDATDMLRLITLGYFNVIASMTASVTDSQIDALCASTLILGYDADKAGGHAHNRIIDRVEGRAAVFEVDWSVASDCNDAGELASVDDLRLVLSKVKPVSRP